MTAAVLVLSRKTTSKTRPIRCGFWEVRFDICNDSCKNAPKKLHLKITLRAFISDPKFSPSSIMPDFCPGQTVVKKIASMVGSPITAYTKLQKPKLNLRLKFRACSINKCWPV